MDERKYAFLMHLSSLLGFLIWIPGFNVVAPLIFWQWRKDDSEWLDRQGKAAVNFQLSILLYAVISGVLTVVLVGIVLLMVVFVLDIIAVILAAVRARDGKDPGYPLLISFIR